MTEAGNLAKDEINDLESFEQLLKSENIMKEEEDLDSFFQKPYSEIHELFNDYFLRQKDFFKPVPNEQSNRLFFYHLIRMTFSTSLYSIHENSKDSKIKLTTEVLYKEIDRTLITELSPYIFSFFHWDFKRRVWNSYDDVYKINYLKKIVEEIDQELRGNKETLVKKYIVLLLEFIAEKFEKYLLQIDTFSFADDQKSKAYELLSWLKKSANKEKLQQVIDQDAEASFMDVYKPIAQ